MFRLKAETKPPATDCSRGRLDLWTGFYLPALLDLDAEAGVVESFNELGLIDGAGDGEGGCLAGGFAGCAGFLDGVVDGGGAFIAAIVNARDFGGVDFSGLCATVVNHLGA